MTKTKEQYLQNKHNLKFQISLYYNRYNPANYQDNTVLTEQQLEDENTNTHKCTS